MNSQITERPKVHTLGRTVVTLTYSSFQTGLKMHPFLEIESRAGITARPKVWKMITQLHKSMFV